MGRVVLSYLKEVNCYMDVRTEQQQIMRISTLCWKFPWEMKNRIVLPCVQYLKRQKYDVLCSGIRNVVTVLCGFMKTWDDVVLVNILTYTQLNIFEIKKPAHTISAIHDI